MTEGRSWGDQPSSLPGTEEVSCDSGLSFLLICVHCIYLFLAVLGLPCCAGFSLVAASGVLCVGLSLPWLLLLWSTGLVAWTHVGSSQIRDGTRVSCIGRQSPYH